MKRIFTIVLLLSLGAALYAAIENIKMKTATVRSITYYVGSNINRYDLGDVECFVETNTYNMFCLRK